MSRSTRTLFRLAAFIAVIISTSGLSYARGFLPAVSYGTGASPNSVAVGDFNGDGKPDLAVANSLSDNVSILLGRGDGTFQASKTLSVGHDPYFVAVGDVNGDGRPDLVTTNALDNSISVLLNNGHGFLPALTYPSGGSYPLSVVVADFDGDGKSDLVVGNHCTDFDCTTHRGVAAFLKGNGDGSFQVLGTYDDGSNPDMLAAGDLDGDGKLDLAVPDFGGSNVSILLGNGDGTFGGATSFEAGASPTCVAMGDFNGDGNLDLAVSNASETLNVLIGDGHGAFAAPVPYTIGVGAGSVAVADFNGDGALDLAVAVVSRHSQGSATVLYGRGDGTFLGPVRFLTDVGAFFVAAGDFNHDRAMDLAVVNGLANNASVLMNSGGTFVATTSSENPAPAGQPVTLTAVVAPSLVSTIPTGKIAFADGATILATVPLDQNGQASFTTSDLSLGTHTIRTKYSGDANFNPNTGKAITQIIQ
jgi:hypothetical protein